MNEKSPLSSPTAHSSHTSNYLRRGSVSISTEQLRSQTVVPTAIPGETKRTVPLKHNGDGRKNILNLITKQVEKNKKEKEFQEAVRSELTKETVIKKERQDKIVEIFLKEPSPISRQNTPKPPVKKLPKKPLVEKPKDRGNLNYFLSQSNFKEPKCLSQDQKKKRSNKYDDIDTRLRTSPSPGVPGNSSDHSTSTTSQPPPPAATRLITKQRLPPNKKPVPIKAKPETTLLPYPQDVSKTKGTLHFNDVWKKVETKDIFPHVNR